MQLKILIVYFVLPNRDASAMLVRIFLAEKDVTDVKFRSFSLENEILCWHDMISELIIIDSLLNSYGNLQK